MSEEAPAIVHSPRDQWLMRRRELVTASDVPAILGIHPTRKPADVYVEKIGLDDERAQTWPMFYGQAFQDGIGAAYSRATGRSVRMESLEKPEIVVHPDIPWLGATLDGVILEGSDDRPAPAAGRGPLEVKLSSSSAEWSTEELPVTFQVQNLVQMACMGAQWGAVAAFVSVWRPPREQDIVFDPEFFNGVLNRLEAFHLCVKTRTPPPDDREWYSHGAIARIWSQTTGETIALDEHDALMVMAWRAAICARDSADAAIETIADHLRLRMAGASVGMLPNGTQALTLTAVKSYPVSYVRAAHTRLTLKDLKTGKGRS